jgi:hypothetical protein
MKVVRDQQGRLLPTGTCWCGCRSNTAAGSFWAPGHDKFAEAAVITLKHGSVAEFLIAEGFGPDGRNVRVAWKESRQTKPKKTG